MANSYWFLDNTKEYVPPMIITIAYSLVCPIYDSMVVNDYIPYTKYIKNNSWENFPTRLFILSLLSIVLPLFSCIARPLLSSSKL